MRASDFESWLFVPAQIVLPPPDLKSFTVTPAIVPAGEGVVWKATLSGAAPTGGETITLTKTVSSGKDPVPGLPATLSVLEGHTTESLGSRTLSNAAGSVSIKATLRGIDKTATLLTQVVSVTIAPPAVTLIPNATVQFSATVKDADDNSATFAIREKSRGGSIAQTGKTTANYTAPSALGVFHVVATSVADPTKSATATVTVAEKTKDAKDIKDTRDTLEDFPGTGGTDLPRASRAKGASGTQRRRAGGQAFIRPEERPPVGEPKGTAKKKSARVTKKKRKP
jgi:hypothetical protein